MQITKEQFLKVLPKAKYGTGKYVDAINKYSAWLGVDTPLRMAHFLAQCSHETGFGARTVENLNYTSAALRKTFPSIFETTAHADRYAGKPEEIANLVYRGRLGNTQPGDGWRFRGRGMLMLTGRYNYVRYSKHLAKNGMELDLTLMPDLLEAPLGAVKSALWFFSVSGCLEAADKDDLKEVTRRICGSSEGLVSRAACLVKAKRAVGLK